MFEDKIKNHFSRQKFVKLMVFIAGATQSEPGYAMAPEEDVKKLAEVAPSFVTVNEGMKADGMVAVKATAEGIAAVNAHKSSEPSKTAAKPVAAQFKIETGIPIPEIQRGGFRTETYPFQQLEVGQSFFVPGTTEKPNPAKSLASTVSSATRRYGKTDGRKFTIRTAEENGVKGARIWREK
jgi:hypothetical protein